MSSKAGAERRPDVRELLADCALCPRECHVDRTAGERGACGQGAELALARAALHFWEEPPISGAAGSGTVFFSGCALGCAYCQNAPIASGKVGRAVSVERLAEIFLEQQGRGALNVNLVTATHFAGQVVEAVELARGRGFTLPVVWNTSGYETPVTVKLLASTVDVWLADFKYASSDLAARYSHAPDYPRMASAALDAMYAASGAPTFDFVPGCDSETGRMTRGVVVRLLLLPGHLDDAFAVLRLLAAKPYADDLTLSLMSQYTPMPGIGARFPELAAPVDPDDYDALVDYALSLGFTRSFMQDGAAAADSFIPAFDYAGL